MPTPYQQSITTNLNLLLNINSCSHKFLERNRLCLYTCKFVLGSNKIGRWLEQFSIWVFMSASRSLPSELVTLHARIDQTTVYNCTVETHQLLVWVFMSTSLFISRQQIIKVANTNPRQIKRGRQQTK